MAGRKDKNTVDYFPHYCETGKTLFILESKFEHGYKIWFKTLELLGKSENHYIDLREETDLLFLISKLKITEVELTEIYNLLSKLSAIDKYLWSKKIVFSENFVNNIEDAYKRRNNKCLHKCDICIHLFNSCGNECDTSTHKSTKKSKGKESKEEDSVIENEIEEIYSLYPSKCPINNSSTGKSKKSNCPKIKKVINEIGFDKLKSTTEWYIKDCVTYKRFLKNFSTFLNNIPEIPENKKPIVSTEPLYRWKWIGHPEEKGTKEDYEKCLKGWEGSGLEIELIEPK